ncbi:MAG: hypothetical protein LC118_15035 [Dehalococcoidia bacterium]|nr:hypothetical protein [Dehalococcoidia bacterium]
MTPTPGTPAPAPGSEETIAAPSPPAPAPITSDDGPSVRSLLRQIQQESLSPRNLAPRDRQACVSHLTAEGYGAPEIAEILKVSERTVARDRKAVLEANALQQDPALVGQLAGRLMAEAELAIGRIRRVARDKDCPPSVRIDGETRCWQILREFVQSLQSLGYLPTAAQRIEADLTHRAGEIPTPESLEAEFVQIVQIQQACRPDDAILQQQIEAARSEVDRLLASDRLSQIKHDLQQEQSHDVQT